MNLALPQSLLLALLRVAGNALAVLVMLLLVIVFGPLYCIGMGGILLAMATYDFMFRPVRFKDALEKANAARE